MTELEKEMLETLKALVPIVNKAFDYDGDVFGRLHNGAVDALQEAERIVNKSLS